MRFSPTEDQRALADAVAGLLAKRGDASVVRAGREQPLVGPLAELWRELGHMGVLGVLAPEALGGSGLDWVTAVLILEEAGRAAIPLPLLETIAVAVPALVAAGDPAAMLPGVLGGEAVASASLDADRILPAGRGADVVILAADDRLSVHAGADLDLEPVAGLDRGRHLARVGKVTRGTALTGLKPAEARERAALGAAAELVGLGAAMLELTVDYVKNRRQFGRPVGSFQAVKHHLADVLLAVEFARPVVWYAAYAIDAGLPERRRAVSMAKAQASEAARRAAGWCLQCHGAMGYTEEYDLQLWMKRSWALAAAYGNAAWHRERVGRELGLFRETDGGRMRRTTK
jgi:alkylation response protein AidB-like acyl-CoA dehydrogenase